MTLCRIATLLIGSISFCLVSSATTVYLPAGPPWEARIVSPGCTNTTPTVCTVTDATGLAVNDVVGVWGVASSATNHMSSVRGLLKIKAISGNLITLKDMAGADLAANGTWEDGSLGGEAAGPQRMRKMTAFSVVDGPKGIFDGWTGPVTRSWALGTHNGLTSLTVTSNVATVTTSYNHGLASSNKVTVWNTNNATFTPSGGREFTIAVTSPTTYTFPVTVGNADYTHNDTCGPGLSPNGTIQGTDNCVRISSRVTSTNQWWTSIASFSTTPATLPFLGTGVNRAQYGVFCALRFFVDQKAQAYLDYAMKFMLHLEVFGGNNFPANEAVADGGNYTLAAQVSEQDTDAAEIFSIVKGFLTSTQKQRFLDQILNDIGDPTPCNKVLPQRIAVTTGTATAADATHITLAAGASAVTDFYANNIAEGLNTSGYKSDALITAYNGTTKVATVSGWSGGTPVSTTAYSVFESFSPSAGTALTTVTITGYNTHWNTVGADRLQVGDYIFGALNNWPGFLDPRSYGGMVQSVIDDTHATIFVSDSAITTTPQAVWITHPWQTGDCGTQWLQNYWTATLGSQPSQYPPRGGNSWQLADNIGGDLAAFQLQKHFALVDDDPRAITNVARFGILGTDENLELYMSYWGMFFSGTSYGPGRAQQGAYQIAWALSKNVIGYPDLDLSGPWVQGYQEWKIYGLKPDIYDYPRTGDAFNLRPPAYLMALDYGVAFNPTSTPSKYTKYLLNNVLHFNTSGAISATGLADYAVRLDPNAPVLDYTTQPLQYLLTATSRAAAITLGRTYPATWRGDAFISRTGWTNTCDTHVWYGARTFIESHDSQVQPGDLQVWKCGMFLSNDDWPAGDMNNVDTGPYLEFGGAPSYRSNNTLGNGPAIVNITRWAGTPPYGDANSTYAYALSDLAGAYTTPLTRAQRHVVHLKKPGTEEIIITFADVVSPTAIKIRDQLYYVQNGQSGDYRVIYPEGTTSYPGSGGCGSLDTNRTVLSQQDGGTSAPIPGGPTPADMLPGRSPAARQYNLITKFLSPGTITLHCDGSSGPFSAAERVSIYAGGSVGGTATSLESIVVHKLATQPDTTLTAAPLNPDANWTGVQTTDKVVLFARGGTTYSTLTGLTTTHSGTAQYLIAGLTSGYYDVYNGATKIVSGAAVVDGDNSLEFENVSGSYTINPLGSVTITTVPPLQTGQVGTAYTQSLTEAGGTPPFTWSIASGSLPAGLSLNSSTGAISGTPGAASTSNFTIHVADNLGVGDSKAFSIVVYDILAIPTNSPLPAGAPGVSYNQSLSATGGDGNYTWTRTAGALPSGLSLSAAGTITGTPMFGETQVFTIHVTSGDGQGLSKQFSITIVVPVGVANSSPLPTGRFGTPYSQSFAGFGGTSPYTWSVISGSLPVGLSLASDGAFSGIPSSSGDFTFTIQVVDSLGVPGTKPFSLTIFGILSITSTSPLSAGLVGTSYSQNLAAAGGDGSYTWTISSGALPSGLTLASNGVITGTLTQPGVSSVTIQVSSGDSQTSSGAFFVTVGIAPAATKAGSTVKAGTVIH